MLWSHRVLNLPRTEEGTYGDQAPFMAYLYRRPPCDGRFSIALSLTLSGQKGPIFPKKIGASGGWAEPHLLAFTVS
ncbi:hypothetical protein [Sphingobacterium multivorum]|uniref:hypothetical protein n=1 Tax=Sphingobacterium multivorum TaxID=28454 RepID=UPI003DA1E4F1